MSNTSFPLKQYLLIIIISSSCQGHSFLCWKAVQSCEIGIVVVGSFWIVHSVRFAMPFSKFSNFALAIMISRKTQYQMFNGCFSRRFPSSCQIIVHLNGIDGTSLNICNWFQERIQRYRPFVWKHMRWHKSYTIHLFSLTYLHL